MTEVFKTPGVYIVEEPTLPTSVVEVATAVPAFIGYTERADNQGTSLLNIPWRITSLAEYLLYFGGPQKVPFHVKKTDRADGYSVTATLNREQMFLLAPSMRLFFQNGGGPCYIVSVGSYADGPIDQNKLTNAIDLLLKEPEPTLLVIPDAIHLPTEAACIGVQQYMVQHCGQVQSRMAILDVYDDIDNGHLDHNDPAGDPVESFRDNIGLNNLNYAAAYYPWLQTTVLTDSDITDDFMDADDLTALRTNASDHLPSVIAEIQRQLNTLPPSAAIAGVYTAVDNAQGVWKAPANVTLAGVSNPTVHLSDNDQQKLNVDTQGKAINAIRAFSGEGVLVWGAQTLDANSQDWRYIHVRRTMIMLEQSIKLASMAYVFESNVAATWLTLKSMITNFLTDIWKRGGLAGTVPAEAFSVHCGLGDTMTADDILEGILRVAVQVAITHPAEFIEITFQQQMPKS